MADLPVVGTALRGLESRPLELSDTETDRILRRNSRNRWALALFGFALVLGVLIYLGSVKGDGFTTLLSAYCAFLLGVVVGAGELMDRYRDNPVRSLAGIPGFIYWAVNGTAAAAAFLLIDMFGWTFGSAPENAAGSNAIQVLVAGFGAMALFRSSLFTARIGDKDVGIGPHIVLQTVLKVADSAVDRASAVVRAENVKEIMQSVDADKARKKLPRLCSRLLQSSLSEDDNKAMNVKIKEIFEEEGVPANMGSPNGSQENSKSYLLGLTLMNYMGRKVLASAVNTLDSEIKKRPTLYLTDITKAVNSNNSKKVAVDYLVSAIDAEDKPIQVDCKPPPGAEFTVDETTAVICTAKDEKTGLETTASFKVTITRKGSSLTEKLGLSGAQSPHET